MKKIFLIVAVLILAAPALAVRVDIEAKPGLEPDEVELWYNVDPPPAGPEDGNRPRAFGLNITVTDGDIVDCVPAKIGESNSVSKGYGIFPGTIEIIDGSVSNYGSPVAPQSDLPGDTLAGLYSNGITIEMGSLYEGAYTPPDSGLLCTIVVSTECDVNIALNVSRGGVVMENLGPVDVNFTGLTVTGICVVPDVIDMTQADANAAIIAEGFTVGVIDVCSVCGVVGDFNVISTDPAAGATPGCGTPVDIVRCECYAGQADYNVWKAVGKPICWCYPRFCHGDADGLQQGSAKVPYHWVGTDDLNILGAAWKTNIGDPNFNPCADIDHLEQGSAKVPYHRVGTDDLNIVGYFWKDDTDGIGPAPDPNCLPGNRTP